MNRNSVCNVDLRNWPLCAAILLVSGVLATAQHETILYEFYSEKGDGYAPYGSLVADATGNLYGTTLEGGGSDGGTVYELSPPVPPGNQWTETVLYSFTGGEDGLQPTAALVLDNFGNLYGTTSAGGSPSCRCGTIFELSPPAAPGGSWTETAIYTFSGGDDGETPYADVVFDKAGNLYGTTFYGGGGESCNSQMRGCGTVFELTPSQGGTWTETVLYRFAGGSDGGDPGAPVVLGKAGNLYGTTSYGGSPNCQSGCGVTFELVPSQGGTWTETVLHTFGTGGGDGQSPSGPLLDKAGDLVGTTCDGGTYGFGTVFGLRPPISGGNWTYEVLYSFGPTYSTGSCPASGVISVNSTLYGTTSSGGTSIGGGTVFQLTRTKSDVWKETVLYTFLGGSDGKIPIGGLLLHDGTLYGTTQQGGNLNSNCGGSGCGTVFEISRIAGSVRAARESQLLGVQGVPRKIDGVLP